MKTYIKFFAFMLAIIIPTCLFVGCGSKPDDNGGETPDPTPPAIETTYTLRAISLTTNNTPTRINIKTTNATYSGICSTFTEGYGETVQVSDTYFKFTGTTLKILGKIEYTKSGNTITFSDETVQGMFSPSQMTDQLLSIKLATLPQVSSLGTVTLEYYAGAFIPEFDVA